MHVCNSRLSEISSELCYRQIITGEGIREGFLEEDALKRDFER